MSFSPLNRSMKQWSAVAVLVALVAAQRLPSEDHDAVDRPGGVAQRHGLGAGVDGAAVGPDVAERAFPDTALEHVPGQFGGLLVVLLGDAEGQHGLADVLLAHESEEFLGEVVVGDDVAEAVTHDDRHLHLVKDGLRRQLSFEG
jgi:hypothetical protein